MLFVQSEYESVVNRLSIEFDELIERTRTLDDKPDSDPNINSLARERVDGCIAIINKLGQWFKLIQYAITDHYGSPVSAIILTLLFLFPSVW